MQVGDLIGFEFDCNVRETALVVAKNDEPVPHVEILFFDKAVVTYSMAELEDYCWEVISASPLR